MKALTYISWDYLAHYFAYLVENTHIATAFQVLEKITYFCSSLKFKEYLTLNQRLKID
jgi:hypothetical protein